MLPYCLSNYRSDFGIFNLFGNSEIGYFSSPGFIN